jgi:plastocyanin
LDNIYILRIKAIFLAAAVLAAVAVTAVTGMQVSASPDNGTMYVDPATQTVETGDTFTVNIMQQHDVDVWSIQCNVSFDRKLLQVTKITIGSDWEDNRPRFLLWHKYLCGFRLIYR